jgi:hypothetical protein
MSGPPRPDYSRATGLGGTERQSIPPSVPATGIVLRLVQMLFLAVRSTGALALPAGYRTARTYPARRRPP